MLGNAALILIEAANLLLRLDDPQAALPASGVYLSAAAFRLLGFTGGKGGDLVYRHRVGIPHETNTGL